MLTFARFIFFTSDMGHGTVKRGPTTIHPRKIVKMGWENKFAELWIQVLHSYSRGMKLSKQVYEISNLLEISSDEYH